MLPFQLSERQKFAVDLVKEVSILARHIQEEMVSGSLTKDDRSPVTVADFAVQAAVAAKLEEHFPGEALIAEESAALLSSPEGQPVLERVSVFVEKLLPEATPSNVSRWIDRGGGDGEEEIAWILDPIDGTKGFLRGEQYAVALALLRERRIEMGILGCPRLDLQPGNIDTVRRDQEVRVSQGSLVIAFRGQGCWASPLEGTQFRRLSVSSNSNPDDAIVLRSFESGHTNLSQMESVIQFMQIKTRPVALDSQAKYALLAAGGGDLLFRLLSSSSPDYREKVWDHGAGALAVEEAGGKITDISGAPLDFSHGRLLSRNRGIVASNGRLHDRALQALAETTVSG